MKAGSAEAMVLLKNAIDLKQELERTESKVNSLGMDFVTKDRDCLLYTSDAADE